jgi:hypothetical protein
LIVRLAAIADASEESGLEKLEAASCECYGAVNNLLDAILGWAAISNGGNTDHGFLKRGC